MNTVQVIQLRLLSKTVMSQDVSLQVRHMFGPQRTDGALQLRLLATLDPHMAQQVLSAGVRLQTHFTLERPASQSTGRNSLASHTWNNSTSK